MLAQKIVDGKITMRDFWPIDPVLIDAARYRTLRQLAKFVYTDGVASVQFPVFWPRAAKRNEASKIASARPSMTCPSAVAGDLTSYGGRHTGLRSRRARRDGPSSGECDVPFRVPPRRIPPSSRTRPPALTLLALGVILTYHAMTSPILDWIFR